jgi:hypothetical protein
VTTQQHQRCTAEATLPYILRHPSPGQDAERHRPFRDGCSEMAIQGKMNADQESPAMTTNLDHRAQANHI